MKAREGIPMTKEELEEYNNCFREMEECFEYCDKHPCTLDYKPKKNRSCKLDKSKV